MKRSTILAVSLITTACLRAEIDLAPSVNEYVANGMKMRQLIFRDDKRKIEYEPPQDWSIGGTENQLTFKPKNNFAEAAITVTPLAKPQSLDENAVKILAEQFLASLPVGSQFGKLEEQITNPVLLDGNGSVEMTASYQLMGEKFLRSAIFVNLPHAQLVFRLSARKDDFQSLHRDFKGSILSWHWIEAAATSPETAKSASTLAQ
jgi:hypothetical protein